MNETNTTT